MRTRLTNSQHAGMFKAPSILASKLAVSTLYPKFTWTLGSPTGRHRKRMKINEPRQARNPFVYRPYVYTRLTKSLPFLTFGCEATAKSKPTLHRFTATLLSSEACVVHASARIVCSSLDRRSLQI